MERVKPIQWIAGIGLDPSFFGTHLGWRLAKPFMISAEKGAETTLFLATIADATPFNGGYVVGKVLERPDLAALDDSLARRLWDESARLVRP